ncbi:MAG: hypothetical protein ACI8ZN_000247 [Bacteroidia bacterium]|jgi:hypothetical protein
MEQDSLNLEQTLFYQIFSDEIAVISYNLLNLDSASLKERRFKLDSLKQNLQNFQTSMVERTSEIYFSMNSISDSVFTMSQIYCAKHQLVIEDDDLIASKRACDSYVDITPEMKILVLESPYFN